MMRRTNTVYMILAALFAALLAVSGQIQIPFQPAPITLQTLVVMLAGSLLGALWGSVSMLVFVVLVAMGLPLLAGFKGGIGALLGPTGGYVLSWPLAAWLIGWLLSKWRAKGELKLIHFLIAHFLGGFVVVHLIGFPWLHFVTKLPVKELVFSAFLIFVPGDLLKWVVASIIAHQMQKSFPQYYKMQA